MEDTRQLTNYLMLLNIRQKAYRRDTTVTGVVLLLALVGTTAIMFLTEWSGPSIWITAVFNALIAANYAIARARYEVIKENIEFVKSLQS